MSRLPPVEKLPPRCLQEWYGACWWPPKLSPFLTDVVRDKWEDKKAELEQELSTALGTPWTVDINVNQVYAYAKDNTYAKESPGGLLYDYVNGARSSPGNFFYYFGEERKKEINTICSAHVLTLDVDVNNKVEGNGCEVSPSGQLVMLFHPDSLNSNIESTLEKKKLEKALNEAPSLQPMNFKARSSIADAYQKGIGEVQSIINDQLGREITIEPGFEDAFARLKAGGARDDFDEYLGSWIVLYFRGFAKWLERNDVKGDDMIQEGLNDVMHKGQVAFRIVDQKKGDSSSEAIPEDGVLYLRTDAKNYGSNIDNMTNELMDQL